MRVLKNFVSTYNYHTSCLLPEVAVFVIEAFLAVAVQGPVSRKSR